MLVQMKKRKVLCLNHYFKFFIALFGQDLLGLDGAEPRHTRNG
jgi:hypothetical protein